MYLERIRAENVRHLQAVEHVFSTEAQDLRRWTLLREGKAATALLRCVALVNIGRWQMSQLMARVAPLLASDPDHPARLEFVLIQHAPQERGPQGSVQRQYGWRLHADGRAEALRRRTLHTQPRAPGRAGWNWATVKPGDCCSDTAALSTWAPTALTLPRINAGDDARAFSVRLRPPPTPSPISSGFSTSANIAAAVRERC